MVSHFSLDDRLLDCNNDDGGGDDTRVVSSHVL